MQRIDEDMKRILRNSVQDAAYTAWENAGRRGTVVAGTGVGKSKIAIRRVKEICRERILEYVKAHDGVYPDRAPRMLLVTPTEGLRDVNWPDEFTKWDAKEEMEFVKRICYASLNREKGIKYDYIILDEAHRVTSHNAEGFLEDGTLTEFLTENMGAEIMALTATEPDAKRDMMKAHILDSIAPVCFRYTLDQAVADGILPPYEIIVIQVPLERLLKEIPGGSKASPFMQSEFAAYEFMNKKIKAAYGKTRGKDSTWVKSLLGARRQFICNLPSKTRIAEKVIRKVVHEQKQRTLIFCGSIDQSRKLCGQNVYNSSVEDKKRDMLTAFKNKQINYLGVVEAVNEGHNIPDIQKGICVQLNSNERDFTQRLGRLLRGEEPIFYLIVAQGTQDEKWASSALEDFDRKRIRYDSYLNWI